MRLIALLLLLCTLSACSLAPNEYLSVTPHAHISDRVTQTDAVVVSDYAQLKTAILEQVRSGRTQGSIRTSNYQGELESDLAQAAYEVAKVEPLGAYAVDYMTHDCTLIVNYYEVDIRITFRRTAREIAAMEHMISPTLFSSRLKKAVDNLEERIVVELHNYRDLDIPTLVEAYCVGNPGTVMEVPTVSVSVYPNSGSIRIVEVDLTYTETPETLRQMRKAVAESVNAAAEYIRYRQTDREKAELLYTYMTERFNYRDEATMTPVHDALCAGVADPAGLANAFELVCDRAGVRCWTVTGLRGGEEHCWNILSYDGEYRHVDLKADILSGSGLRFRTDTEMSDYYWNQAEYPACIAVAPTAPEQAPPVQEAPPAEEEPPAETPPAEDPESPPPTEETDPEAPQPEEPIDDQEETTTETGRSGL